MSVPRPMGEYKSRMSVPPKAWPDADEDDHSRRAGELLKTGLRLQSAATGWNEAFPWIFDGHTWDGSAAEAGKNKVQGASASMDAVGTIIGDAITFHRRAYNSIKNAKDQIVMNCESAQRSIDELISAPTSRENQGKRDKAIEKIVNQALRANTAVVSSASTAIAAGQDVPQASDSMIPNYAEDVPQAAQSPQAALGVAPSSSSGATAPPSGTTAAKGNIPDNPRNALPPSTSTAPLANRNDSAATNRPPPSSTTAPTSNKQDSAPPRAISPPGGASLPNPGEPTPSTAPNTPSLNMGGGGGAPSAPSTGGGASSGGSTSSPSQSMSGASAGAKAGADMGAAKADPSADAKNAPAKAGATGASGGGGEKAPADQVAKGLSTAQAATAQPTMAPAAATAPPPTPLAPPSDPAASAPIQHTAGSTGGGGGGTGGGGVGGMAGGGGSFGSPATSAPTPPPMPLGPPATPPPAGPPSPGSGGSTPGQTAASTSTGPGVNPASASRVDPALAGMAPIPVSPARLERDAILSASTAGAMQRHRGNASAALIQARRIAAALNMGAPQYGFYWVTGLTADGSIVVANSFGLAYVPDGIELPAHVTLASADETISPVDRGKWATYPILAIQGWAQAHDQTLRAVIATKEQFANFDPGVPKVVLQPDDIPETGKMQGRSRLEVIAPSVATRLASVPDAGLQDLLPVAPTDSTAPEDKSAALWFALIKPLMSTSPDRGVAHLEAFVAYADHAQELALHKAHNALDAEVQRAAIADWVYWQHLSVLMSDAISAEVTV